MNGRGALALAIGCAVGTVFCLGAAVGSCRAELAAPAPAGCAESAQLLTISDGKTVTCPAGTRLEVSSAGAISTMIRCVCPASSAAAVDAGADDGG